MGKINIKSVLKSSTNLHVFEGKGIIKHNEITYNDDGIITKLTLNEPVFLERKKDYEIKIGFQINKNIKGTYITKEGNFETKTVVKQFKNEKNHLRIKYDLMINNIFIDTFDFNFKYTIHR